MISCTKASITATLLVPLVAWGCGSAPMSKADLPDRNELAAAEAELAAAEARIPGEPPAATGYQQPSPPAPGTDPQPQLQAQSPAPADRPLAGSDADSCQSACDALTAMKKAADRICALAPGPRCEAARTRVANAEKRVMEACPGCET
jgi:hypothetical protein